MRLFELIKQYILQRSFDSTKASGKGYELILRNFCLYLHNPPILHVTIEHVLGYYKLLEELGWDRNSIWLKNSVFRKFFEYAHEKGYQSVNPNLLPKMRQERFKQPRVATEEDLQMVLDTLRGSKKPEYIRQFAMTMILADTGARLGEILSLKVKDLQEKTSIIRTEKNRGSKPFRQIFWSDETNEAIEKWLKIRVSDSEFLFTNVHVKKHLGTPVNVSGIGRWYRRFSQRIGLKKTFNCHSLRHKFGRDLNKAGANNSQIANLMGHVDMQSSFIYTMLDSADMKDAYTRFKKKS